MNIKLYNSLTRKKEVFIPIDAENVRLYVCGPTVYAPPHIGNARSIVIYDILYRLLRHQYKNVKYVRNITDIDDKINESARKQNVSIGELTAKTITIFHNDMNELGVLSPDIEPRATRHIAEIITMIEQLIKNGNAYEAENHILFNIMSDKNYGILSHRIIDEMLDGVRVKNASYKKNIGDFVLWKPSDEEDDESSRFISPWGVGRPGWHIECSAMAVHHLGENFDIHGGGADLMFPHHENEIAQSCCANKDSHYVNYWIHNGFLTVNGEKMSKSLGNFITVRNLLDDNIDGEVIRLALLMTHYRKPLDWNDKLLFDAQKHLDYFYRIIADNKQDTDVNIDEFIKLLNDDMNISEAISYLHNAPHNALNAMGALLGILQKDPKIWFKGNVDDAEITALIATRTNAKINKNWEVSDKIRDKLKAMNIILEDKSDGTTAWRKK